MPPSDDLARRRQQLTLLAADLHGSATTVEDVRRLDGHGGESLAVGLRLPTGEVRRLVVRLAPEGVPRRGNTDVLRQVPLLDALARTPVPIARLVAHGTDADWFGTDVIVQEWVDGAPLHLFEPGQSVAPGTDPRPLVRAATETLATLHAVDDPGLDAWSPVTGVAEELATWARLVPRMLEPAWAESAHELHDLLLTTDPGGHRAGPVHGDYQTNNVLFARDDHRVLAVVDWELAGRGPIGLDVGWLAMIQDPSFWGAPLRERHLAPVPAAVVHRWYEEASGQPLDAFAWYVALACFRYAAISSYNVRLHRTGRRIDPFNEATAVTVPVLLRRGRELVT